MMIRAIAAAIAIGLAAGLAVAGEDTENKDGGDRRDGNRSDRRDHNRSDWHDQDVRELIDTVMLVRASKQLELTDEETVVFVKRFNQQREKFRELYGERYKTHRALREALESGADDGVIQQHLDAMIAHDRRVNELKHESYLVMAEGLDTTQQAKLYMFLQEFESNLRRLIDKARESRWRGRDGDRERGPGDDELRRGPDARDGEGPHAPPPPIKPGDHADGQKPEG